MRHDGWAVSARIQNETPATLVISRRHSRGGTEFGILLFGTPKKAAVKAAGPGLLASRFDPPLPVRLRPGEAWAGTFVDRERLPGSRYVRIQLGSFGASGTVRPPFSMQFNYITDHALRLPRAR